MKAKITINSKDTCFCQVAEDFSKHDVESLLRVIIEQKRISWFQIGRVDVCGCSYGYDMDGITSIVRISKFRKNFYFLSNFYPLQFPITLEGHTFATSEHAYQALRYADDTVRALFTVTGTMTAGQAKCYKDTHPPDIMDESQRIALMRRVLYAKFHADNGLIAKLLHTGDAELIEGNNWGDTFWGQVMNPFDWDHVEETNPNGDEMDGSTGFNTLGYLLMNLRRTINENILTGNMFNPRSVDAEILKQALLVEQAKEKYRMNNTGVITNEDYENIL